jgi:isochorismate synthase
VIGDDQVRRTDPFVTTRIGKGAATLVTGVIPSAAFGEAAVTPVPAPQLYGGAVEEVVRRIRAGHVRKVVLARTIEVAGDRAFDPRRLAHRLRAVDPHAFSFIAPAGDGVLVGASPELLISRQGSEVRANPLAGSAPRAGDKDEDRANADALVASSKDREEHAIVVDAIVAALRPLCATLTWDRDPVLLETANVWHLSTRFRGRLIDPAPSALDLALALHPTPAVAGVPTDAALAAIDQLEGFRRGFYAGPVGWVDAEGNGVWAIALRCALLSGDRATLYAGAGIVGASDPAREIDETDRKFRAFLDALRWG